MGDLLTAKSLDSSFLEQSVDFLTTPLEDTSEQQNEESSNSFLALEMAKMESPRISTLAIILQQLISTTYLPCQFKDGILDKGGCG